MKRNYFKATHQYLVGKIKDIRSSILDVVFLLIVKVSALKKKNKVTTILRYFSKNLEVIYI